MDSLNEIKLLLQSNIENEYKLKKYEKRGLWRYCILKQHNCVCRLCNTTFPIEQLEAHHILPVRLFPHLLYDLNNGVPLCLKCHPKTYRKELVFVSLLTPYLKSQIQILDSINKEELKKLIQGGCKRVFELIEKKRFEAESIRNQRVYKI